MPNFDRYQSIAKEVLGQIIFDVIRDEEEDFGLVTVTKVIISSDQSYMDVYVSCFKNEENLPKALAKNGFFIQREANKKIQVRRVPKIRFRYDDEGDKQATISKAINDLKISDLEKDYNNKNSDNNDGED